VDKKKGRGCGTTCTPKRKEVRWSVKGWDNQAGKVPLRGELRRAKLREREKVSAKGKKKKKKVEILRESWGEKKKFDGEEGKKITYLYTERKEVVFPMRSWGERSPIKSKNKKARLELKDMTTPRARNPGTSRSASQERRKKKKKMHFDYPLQR